MIINRGWAVSLALAEGYGLGAFVILHGIDRFRAEAERQRGAAARPTRGWGLESQSDFGERPGVTSARDRRCCACKRGRACPDPGKHPRVIKDVQEHGHLDAMPSDQLLELIKELRPRPINLGIVPAPGMLVLDIDPRNDGPATLRSLEARYGPLPPTLGVYTGGGGEHRYWYIEPGQPRRSSIGPGLDIKTAGGLLVAPPSVHLSGRRYAWMNRHLTPAHCAPWLDQVSRTQETVSGGAGSQPVSRAADGVLAREMAATPVGELSLTFYRLACWALETDDDIDALRMAARAAGLNERKIASQLAGAQRKVRGMRR